MRKKITSALEFRFSRSACLTFLIFLFALNPVLAQTPYSSKAVRFAESPSLLTVIANTSAQKNTVVVPTDPDKEINEKNEIPLKIIDPNATVTPDAAVWTRMGANNRVTAPNPPSLTFDGLSTADNTSVGFGLFSPPDPTGEVGPNHYVQAQNLTFRIFSKTGVPLTPAMKISSLFTALGPPASTTDDGDPIVLYDQLADRWIISQFMLTFNPRPHQLIAVSKTGDPTGAYYLYDFVMPNLKFNDYPHFGVWPDGYYMTDNQFNQAGNAFQGAGNFAFDRAKMLAGDPTASYIYFDLCPTNSGCVDGGMLPSDLDGLTLPPAGAPNVFAEFDANEYGGTDAIKLWDFHADFAVPANSTFIPRAGSPLAVSAFNPNTLDIPQPGTTRLLDALNDRLMFRLAYRNRGGVESLILNHTVVGSTVPTSRAGVRFYQLNRTSPSAPFIVAEQQTFAGGVGDLDHRWMASAAMNHQGDIAVGYSASNNTATFPSLRYAAKLGTDPMGSGLLQGEQTLFAGTGSQTGSARWGDYSQMSIDPIDDCTFWYTQEYYSTTASVGWKTRIAKFNPGPCTVSPRGTISGTITNCSTGLPIANALVSISGGYSRSTQSDGTYSVTVTPGTYTATVTGPIGAGYGNSTSGSLVVSNGGIVTFTTCITGVSIIAADGSSLTAESCAPVNTAIDPNETVTVNFSMKNIGALSTTNLVATLQATGGVTNPSGPQNYGVVVAGGATVSRPFTFTVSNLTCGAALVATFQLQDGATNLGTITYTFITGGTTTSGPVTVSYTGPAVPIPDNSVAGVDIILPVSLGGTVSDLNFRFDAVTGCDNTAGNANAAVTHTFLGDLIFKLTSPGGTSLVFMNKRGGGGNNICTLLLDDEGGFPAISTLPTTGGVSGNFKPESPFSVFDGQSANGNWVLNVSDIANVDVGTLNRFSLILTTTTPVCCILASPSITTYYPRTGATDLSQVSNWTDDATGSRKFAYGFYITESAVQCKWQCSQAKCIRVPGHFQEGLIWY